MTLHILYRNVSSGTKKCMPIIYVLYPGIDLEEFKNRYISQHAHAHLMLLDGETVENLRFSGCHDIHFNGTYPNGDMKLHIKINESHVNCIYVGF